MLPWGQIITTSLTLADLAHNLYKKTKKKPTTADNTEDGIIERIEALEVLQNEQANLLQKLADQNKNMIRKIKNAYLIAVISPVISLIILLLYFLK